MKKLAALGGVAGGGFAGLVIAATLAGPGHAADRAAPQTAAPGLTPMATITDVYAWMSSPPSNLRLVMDVSPADDGSHSFDPSVVYVFHLTSKSGSRGVDVLGGTETDVICRFGSNTSVQCWVTSAGTTKDFVTGDPSKTTGVASMSGKVKVFAGRRSDPSSFNVSGFNMAVQSFTSLLSSGGLDLAGCPAITDATGLGLRNTLSTGSDSFAATNVMAIVVQIDKSLVNADNNKVVGIWGSTHVGQ
ncbi:MAG TPA: DUF4331 family protein [Kofleriaceae bacterium]